MTYFEALNYIHSLNRFGIKPGLERIHALCAALGNPQDKLNFVHVAGTNGKGSTSTMIARALEASGKKVGLFTSPYVTDFRERICIGGEMVEKELFASVVSQLQPIAAELAARDMQPTEFEMITAAAFVIFERTGCEICVLEVGLGGKFDSTNIIKTPLLSVIASISLDHTAVLGDTVEEIAAEKCGIIKQGGKTVCYPLQKDSVLKIIEDTCAVKFNSFTLPDTEKIQSISNSITGIGFEYKNQGYKLAMSGEYQVYNAVTAIEACRLLGLSEADIKRGIEAAKVAARMEVISASPLVLLDGGHNEDGGRAVGESLKTLLAGKKIIAVMGMMQDKNVDAYLSFVAPLCECVVATSVAENPRSMMAADLAENAKKYCRKALAFENAGDAVNFAVERLKEYDAMLVCGSLYLAGEVRTQLKNIF